MSFLVESSVAIHPFSKLFYKIYQNTRSKTIYTYPFLMPDEGPPECAFCFAVLIK